jgi:hypothetical protein
VGEGLVEFYTSGTWVEVDFDGVKVKGQVVYPNLKDGFVTVYVGCHTHRLDPATVSKTDPPTPPEPDYRELVYKAIQWAHGCGEEETCMAADDITDQIDRVGSLDSSRVYKALGEGLIEEEVDSW